MTIKVEDFRLLSYTERLVLVQALAYWEAKHEDFKPEPEYEAAQALAKRLSATECQPGGCEYCNPGYKHWEDDYDA